MIFKPQIHFFKNLKYGAVGGWGECNTREFQQSFPSTKKKKAIGMKSFGHVFSGTVPQIVFFLTYAQLFNTA